MSDFDWQIDENEEYADFFDQSSKKPGGRGPWFWLVTLGLLLLIIGGWGLVRFQLNRSQAGLRQQLQNTLDLAATAVAAGDGDLFFSVQADDPAWFSALMQPENLALYGAGLEITNVQQTEEALWANVAWTVGESSYQRVMFFEMENGQLRQIPTAPGYWGRAFRLEHEWGQLSYPELDDPWSGAIAQFVDETIEEICNTGCIRERLPLTLVVTSDFSNTAEPGRLHIPSPRLLGLDEAGEPSDLFWTELRQQLRNVLTPATIRFAVPTEIEQMANYEAAAAAFMKQQPHITVKIVVLDEAARVAAASDMPAILAYDGAAFALTEELLASGGIYDLTDFVNTDPNFDQADFYEQIWQGAWWRERMWFMPHAGEMKLIYFDREAYQEAEYPEPSLRWTWEEMAQDMIIVSNPFSRNRPQWGFLDVGNDALFSYAYNWENDCTESATVRCNHPLEPAAVAAALTWYADMAGEPGEMPDLSTVEIATDLSLLNNWQSARRRAALWVDSPADYEFRLLLAPLGVVPFPGSNRFDGITPLQVHGHFISQQARNPQAVWEWLRFLSQQKPSAEFRYVPARPSVAEESNFWRILPRELGNPMRIAFPFARPVTFTEARYFTWEQVFAVLTGEASPAEAVSIMPDIIWFQRP